MAKKRVQLINNSCPICSGQISDVAVVSIRVPAPITASTRSSIHFIEKTSKKDPLSGGGISVSSW
ncbi:MAG: hypothetical protein CMA82_05005 [Euryarchaeota archaeon]|nr:hypothetical protein [Euryarchaeota archaeon]